MTQHFFRGLGTKQALFSITKAVLAAGTLGHYLALAFKTHLPRLTHRAPLRLGHLLVLPGPLCPFQLWDLHIVPGIAQLLKHVHTVNT